MEIVRALPEKCGRLGTLCMEALGPRLMKKRIASHLLWEWNIGFRQMGREWKFDIKERGRT